PAAVRFLSCEPLLGEVDVAQWLAPRLMPHDNSGHATAALFGEHYLRRLDWIIAGGESGPGARPMHPDWARSLRDQCASAGVAFHFKQWGEWVPADAPEAAQSVRAHQFDKIDFVPNDGSRKIDDPALNVIAMARVGKRAAGRLLDGREHNEFPGIEALEGEVGSFADFCHKRMMEKTADLRAKLEEARASAERRGMLEVVADEARERVAADLIVCCAKLEAAERQAESLTQTCGDRLLAHGRLNARLEAAEAKISDLGQQLRQASDSLAEANRRREHAAKALEVATEALRATTQH